MKTHRKSKEELVTKVFQDVFEKYDLMNDIISFGIHRMKRNHIHLAIGEPGEARSGIRHDSSIIIYIDIKKAIESGISFFISPNNVILTKGLNGFLPKSTFVKVYDRKKKEFI